MKKILTVLMIVFCVATGFAADNIQNIDLQVTEKGFVPNKIDVKAGSHVVLKVTRKTDDTCATHIAIKDKKIKKELPLNKEVSVDVGVLKKGEIRFACGMDMVTGLIVVK